MRGMATPVEQIKDRLTILDVVSSYVKLTPAGKSYKGKSPFTNEKTPSFFVSPDKGLYHCFSTGKGGDMFTFVEEMEGIDFKGALKILAERAGVSLVRQDPKKEEERDRLYSIMERSAAFFESELAKNDEAKTYLKERGVEEKSIEEFRIGFAPASWRDLYEVLRKDFSDKEIVLSGMGKQSPKGVYDTFRDRIMFPICDTAGRVIAFSGRILHPDTLMQSGGKPAKYVNSPDTPLFNKSDILFALDKAKAAIRKYDFTILVEGQFDVLMLHQVGFRNTVGVSGTALSDSLEGRSGINNLGLVRRLSDKLILCFDSDEAGVKAAKRSAGIALSLGMDVKVVAIPDAKDPADFIRAEGKDGFSKILREARHVIEFATLKLQAAAKDERDLGRRIKDEILPDVAFLSSEIEKSFFVKKISDISGVSEEALWKDLEKINVSSSDKIEEYTQEHKELSRKAEIEKKLVGLYFTYNSEELRQEISRVVGEDAFAGLVAMYEPIKDQLAFEVESAGEGALHQGSFKEMLENLQEEYLQDEVLGLKAKLKKAESLGLDEEAEILTRNYQEVMKRLGDIKNQRYLNKF